MILIDHEVDTILLITRQNENECMSFSKNLFQIFISSTDCLPTCYGRHMWLVLCTHCKPEVDQDEVAVMCERIIQVLEAMVPALLSLFTSICLWLLSQDIFHWARQKPSIMSLGDGLRTTRESKTGVGGDILQVPT